MNCLLAALTNRLVWRERCSRCPGGITTCERRWQVLGGRGGGVWRWQRQRHQRLGATEVCVCVWAAQSRASMNVGGGQVCGRVGGYRGLVVVEAACGLPGLAAPVLGSLCPPHLSRAVCRDWSDKTRPNYAGLVQQFEFWAGRVAPLCRLCQGTNFTKKTQSHLCVARKWIQMDSLPLGFRWDFWKGLRSALVGGVLRRLPTH